jgi:hypothetical protein
MRRTGKYPHQIQQNGLKFGKEVREGNFDTRKSLMLTHAVFWQAPLQIRRISGFRSGRELRDTQYAIPQQ